jgi:hypothetical protein
MKQFGIREEQGSILITAVVLSFATILLGVTFLTFAVTLHNNVSYEIADKQSLYDTQAAAMQGLADRMGGQDNHGLWQQYYQDNWIRYDYSSEDGQDIDIGTLKQIKVYGSGRSDYEGLGINKKMALDFSWETYADYLYITNSERDPVNHDIIYFWTPDTLDGKVHSNDTIHIMDYDDRPRFMKRVTSTRNAFVPPGNHARYDKGKGYRAKIQFPDQATELRGTAGWTSGTGGHDSLTQLALTDNLIYYRKCGKQRYGTIWKIRCDPPGLGTNFVTIPPSGVIFIYGKCWVSASRGLVDRMDGELPESSMADGTFISNGFSGQLTIGSSDTMLIVDNLIYAHSRPDFSVPTTMDSCRDILGLVSENYILVTRLARPTIYINAAMAAVRGSISVQGIYQDIENEKQSLNIVGSLAQRNRGIVHISSFANRGFIEKDYHYDVRLMENPPPHFMRIAKSQTLYLEPLFTNGDSSGSGGG